MAHADHAGGIAQGHLGHPARRADLRLGLLRHQRYDGAVGLAGRRPREYTVEYVERAIARYERDGLESMLNYYNSVASFEGEWYLFATDANDIYHVHPLACRLIGRTSRTWRVRTATSWARRWPRPPRKGVWVEYLWPHSGDAAGSAEGGVRGAPRRDALRVGLLSGR